jgi:1-aminocyclopropane-1-carboxylate deaminase
VGLQMRKMFYFVKQPDKFFANAHLLSFGGSQSNAMVALAQLANARRVPFTYFSRELRLQEAVEGNLALARELGMQHVQLPSDAYHELVRTRNFDEILHGEDCPGPGTRSLDVPQGAAFPEAQDGVKLLADEINEYVHTEWPDRRFSVVLPSGTGTTALYLAQHLDPDIKLYTVPCVGDAAYLKQQLGQLVNEDPTLQPESALMPRVLVPKRKSRFGRLWWPLYDMYHEMLRETEIDFDLVYAAFTWHTLFSDEAVLDEVLGRSRARPAGGSFELEASGGGERELLYVHTGGTSGNKTMLARYARKNRGL